MPKSLSLCLSEEKMQKWGRKKKNQLSLLFVLFLCFFVLFKITILSNGGITRSRGDDDPHSNSNSNPNPSSLPTYLTSNASTPRVANRVLGASDWSKACTTIQSYKRRAAVAAEDGRQHESKSDGCNLFSGRWVYDNRSYPLYEELDCPYMSDQLACRKHGRPDRDYQSWRWQPDSCELKRWNATEMLEKLRGKRLMFAGDSLNRGQWISMVCLVQSAIPAGKKSMTPNAGLTKFMAEEYNASIEFYWAPLIVESNSDDPINHRLDERKIRPDSLLKHAAEWANADILIFNSYLWWRSGNKIKLVWSSSEEDICEEADGIDAMKLALETWAGWVSTSVDPQKQQEQGMESGQRRKLLRRESADRRRGLLGEWI
ncbi:protein trichome birefringence-like 35 isoform X2 [Ananas comosus]|uniref:Protein trichome birefringence-like 35 isoform X2 n=1 Tax=Ananas comosus TaxID=4615 RepID=A0A6P5GIZ4_ANACO|nr:protein trichome birefringence-like 35 isoform X2 [Ananas comosus]